MRRTKLSQHLSSSPFAVLSCPLHQRFFDIHRKKPLLAVFRSSRNEIPMEIGPPTDLRHLTHVTFDRNHGFIGLPLEFEMEIPRRVPSASTSVFGVSPDSMQCSYDRRGNSVPTILLLMQERLYQQGGLEAEGIFRINAENSQEEHVRSQLNKGIVSYDIDVHCLAGLIKAWFRELPSGVLDSLSPDQILHCHTEEQSMELMKLLPSTQGALLDWAVNLMADVVQKEEYNKMNARNIAMLFAPNMTQMSDPLTALMHAVQVMNFLKTLILKVLHDRESAVLDLKLPFSCAEPPNGSDNDNATQGPPCSYLCECHGTEDEALNKMMLLFKDSTIKVSLVEGDCIEELKETSLKTCIDLTCIETKNTNKSSLQNGHSCSDISKLLENLNAEGKDIYNAQEAVSDGDNGGCLLDGEKTRDFFSYSVVLSSSEWGGICGAPCASCDNKSKHLVKGVIGKARMDDLKVDDEKSDGRIILESHAWSTSPRKGNTRRLSKRINQESERIEAW